MATEDTKKAGFVAVVLACAAVAVPLGTARFEFNPAFVLPLKWWIAAIFGFVAATAALAATSRRVSLNLLDLCLFAWHIAILLSVAFSKYRDEALASYPAAVACGLVYVAVRRLPVRESAASRPRFILGFITLAAALVAGYSLVQQCGIEPVRLVAEDADQFSATMINRNLLASFLAAALPLELFLLLESLRGRTGSGWQVPGQAPLEPGQRGFGRPFLLLLCLAVTSAGLATSRTRGAWAAAGAGAVVYVVLALLHMRAVRRRADAARAAGNEPQGTPSGSGGSRIGAACLACTLVISALLVMCVNRTRQESIDFLETIRAAADMESKSVRERKFAWNVAVDILDEDPLLGSGYGTFHAAGQPLKARHMWGARGGELWRLPRHAHNDSLQTAAETGIAGLAGLLFVLLSASYMVSVSLSAGVADDRYLVAAAAGIVVVVVHGIVHFPLYDAPTALVFWILLGFVGRRQSTETKPLPGDKGRIATGVGAVLLVLWGSGGVWLASSRFLGAYSFEWAARKGAECNGAEAIPLFKRAVNLDPSLYYAYFEIVRWRIVDARRPPEVGEVAALMNKATAKAPCDEYLRFNYAQVLETFGKIDEALHQLRTAKAANPTFSPAYMETARILAGSNRPEEALLEYLLWLARSPADVNALFNAGVLLRALGRNAEAREMWLKVLELEPDHPAVRSCLESVR